MPWMVHASSPPCTSSFLEELTGLGRVAVPSSRRAEFETVLQNVQTRVSEEVKIGWRVKEEREVKDWDCDGENVGIVLVSGTIEQGEKAKQILGNALKEGWLWADWWCVRSSEIS